MAPGEGAAVAEGEAGDAEGDARTGVGGYRAQGGRRRALRGGFPGEVPEAGAAGGRHGTAEGGAARRSAVVD